MDDIELGKALRRARDSRGFSQNAVAFELGITQPAYSLMELGITPVSFLRVCQIAKFLGCKASEFIPEEYEVLPIETNKRPWNNAYNRITSHLSYLFGGPFDLFSKIIGWVYIVTFLTDASRGFIDGIGGPIKWTLTYIIALLIVLIITYAALFAIRSLYESIKRRILPLEFMQKLIDRFKKNFSG